MKVAIKVISNPHKEGEYPIHYNGMQVGTAKVVNGGENVIMSIDATPTNDDEAAVITKLKEKLASKKASMTSIGDVDYDIINSQDMLEATLGGFVINDLPDYIPHQ